MKSGKPLTGLAIRPKSLEWALLSATADQPKPAVRHADIDVGADCRTILDALRADRARIVADLHAKCGKLPGPVALSLPASWVLLRVADLPATNPDEVRSMAELQVDKFSPFPADQAVISYEILTQSETQTRLLLSAVPADSVNVLAAALRETGIHPKSVDINLLAWWRLLKDEGKVHSTGSQAFLVLDEGACDVIVATAGIPVAIRSLSGMDELPTDEAHDEIARETVYTLASLDLERAGESLAEVSVWHRDQAPEGLLRRFQDQFGIVARAYPLESLPALSEGVIRRAESRSAGKLNLAPPAWQQETVRLRARKQMIAVSATLLGIWAVGLAVLFGGLQVQKKRLARMEEDQATLDAPAQKARAARERVMSLQQYLDRSHSALECLREVSDLLPPGIELKSFSYRKGKTVEISGEAEAVTAVYDFKKEMEKSELFIHPDLPRTQRTKDGHEVFKLTATLPGGTAR